MSGRLRPSIQFIKFGKNATVKGLTLSFNVVWRHYMTHEVSILNAVKCDYQGLGEFTNLKGKIHDINIFLIK